MRQPEKQSATSKVTYLKVILHPKGSLLLIITTKVAEDLIIYPKINVIKKKCFPGDKKEQPFNICRSLVRYKLVQWSLQLARKQWVPPWLFPLIICYNIHKVSVFQTSLNEDIILAEIQRHYQINRINQHSKSLNAVDFNSNSSLHTCPLTM